MSRKGRGVAVYGLAASLVLAVHLARAVEQKSGQGESVEPDDSAVSEPAAGAASASGGAASSQEGGESGAAVPPAASSSVAALTPPPAGPSPEQVRALSELREETATYVAAAEDYEQLLSIIVRHHFKERRRRVIEELDKQIAVEREQLDAARDEAIRRLEAFLDRYGGANSHPEATPDAMYRLAALKEEKARLGPAEKLPAALGPSIALYLGIIDQFPGYKERAGVHYYLGHALNDVAELEQAQQVWRALVCENRFTVTRDLKPQPLAQDHDEEFWGEWYGRHPLPLDQVGSDDASIVAGGVAARDEELRFVDPYEDCEAIVQEVLPGQEPRYVAEVWWQLGNFHFDQLDTGAGPYAFNRALSAYQHSLQYRKPPLYGVALYKLAWTLFREQRYQPTVQAFVQLLQHADELEAETGDPGTDFREEAYTYIAASLTYVDFAGPPPAHPYIPRNDVLDLEPDPIVAERKMSVALTRLQDPRLIPQEEKWTVEIYKALAREFSEMGQLHNAVQALELALAKFGLDRDAPKLQARAADIYDELARQAKEGSAAQDELNALALAARTRLSAFVGDSPWKKANEDDPEALIEAEELVRVGLQRAAADHTNFARAYLARAAEVQSSSAKGTLLAKATDEYQQAAQGWAAYIDQNPNAVDAYESRFWLADALHGLVSTQVENRVTPAAEEVERAIAAAEDVRDSNEDDLYLQPAAYYVVSVADQVLEDQYRLYEQTGGALGLRRRDNVEFSGTGADRQVVQEPVPKAVLRAALARDDYNRRIELANDPQKNGLTYAFQAAELFFVYGDFKHARPRFEAILEQHCGRNEWGYRAWEMLLSMSNFEGDAARSRELADGRSCAFDEETRAKEDAIRKPVRQGVAYLDARELYDAAEALPAGADRDAKWREAAAAYKKALDAAPDRDEAPEAAMNGAFAYKQVGEYDKAIEMYELFISRYGSETKLQQLVNGDAAASPPVAADPAQYAARVKFLKLAYDALASANVLFFDYPKAASTFDTIAGVQHFAPAARQEAAQQALSLYASLGDKAGMRRTHTALVGLGPDAATRAEADFVLAGAPLKRWDQFSPNTGANARARAEAESAMSAYYRQNADNLAAAPYVVEAAYWVAKMRQADGSGDSVWWQRAMNAFAQHKATAPRAADGSSSALGGRVAAMAAEGAYIMLDRQLAQAFDYDAGYHHFKGTPQEVLTAYRAAASDAKQWFDRLQRVVDDYAAPEWATAAVARQGTLYDSLRTGLFNARPPELQMFDAATEKKLRLAEESDNPVLQEKADAIRVRVENQWRDARDRELTSADQIMVARYGNAIAMARRYNVSTPAVVRAIQRLSFFTDVIGEAKLQSYTARVQGLDYRPGMFLRIRPGLVTSPEPNGLPPVAPVAVEVGQ